MPGRGAAAQRYLWPILSLRSGVSVSTNRIERCKLLPGIEVLRRISGCEPSPAFACCSVACLCDSFNANRGLLSSVNILTLL
jgi:hypothetical protein